MKKNILIGRMGVFALALVASAALAGPGYGRGAGYGAGYGNPPISNLAPEWAMGMVPGDTAEEDMEGNKKIHHFVYCSIFERDV